MLWWTFFIITGLGLQMYYVFLISQFVEFNKNMTYIYFFLYAIAIMIVCDFGHTYLFIRTYKPSTLPFTSRVKSLSKYGSVYPLVRAPHASRQRCPTRAYPCRTCKCPLVQIKLNTRPTGSREAGDNTLYFNWCNWLPPKRDYFKIMWDYLTNIWCTN